MIDIHDNLKSNPLKRIVFMGSPDFAVHFLAALRDLGEQIIAVITQPDRPSGRGHHLTPPPVKIVAQESGLPVFQPADKEQLVSVLTELHPDIVFVVAYGMIIPSRLVNSFLCINLHASILPRYRGASPVQSAIRDGVQETGISVMVMDEHMDTGPLILSERIPVSGDDTAGSLFARLENLAGSLMSRTLQELREKREHITIMWQDHERATYTRKITKQDGLLNLSMPPAEIVRMVKAYNPWPGAYLFVDDDMVKLLDARVGPDGKLEILTVQPAGKKAMGYQEYLRGHKPLV